jgi:hypothetical protein
MIEGRNEELKIPEEEKEAFSNRLADFLQSEPLLYPVKGPIVLHGHDHVFTHARIFTDIRPLFREDLHSRPCTAAILNTLQLTCLHGGDLVDFYVAMDEDDLDSLEKVVDRAKRKTANLKELVKDMGLTCLEV